MVKQMLHSNVGFMGFVTVMTEITSVFCLQHQRKWPTTSLLRER